MKQILSVSRRTDVPAFYGDWFMNRIKECSAGYANPFGGKKYSVSLAADDVHFIVFWSRDYAPFIPHLGKLHDVGYQFYFQFTITGLPEILESNVPSWREAVDTARRLADMFSADHVLWRFDPIVFSSYSPADMVRKNFNNILEAISGATRRCTFSYVDYYGKVRRNSEKLHEKTGIRFRVDTELEEEFHNPDTDRENNGAFIFDLSIQEQIEFAQSIAADASAYGISLYTCCEHFLVTDREPLITKGHCVDPELITRITGEAPAGKFNPTRKDCGCWESRDIGAYDTCPHGCVYCYANVNKQKALTSFDRLTGNPDSFSLTPGAAREDFPPVPSMPPDQGSLWNDYTWFNYFKK